MQKKSCTASSLHISGVFQRAALLDKRMYAWRPEPQVASMPQVNISYELKNSIELNTGVVQGGYNLQFHEGQTRRMKRTQGECLSMEWQGEAGAHLTPRGGTSSVVFTFGLLRNSFCASSLWYTHDSCGWSLRSPTNPHVFIPPLHVSTSSLVSRFRFRCKTSTTLAARRTHPGLVSACRNKPRGAGGERL